MRSGVSGGRKRVNTVCSGRVSARRCTAGRIRGIQGTCHSVAAAKISCMSMHRCMVRAPSRPNSAVSLPAMRRQRRRRDSVRTTIRPTHRVFHSTSRNIHRSFFLQRNLRQFRLTGAACSWYAGWVPTADSRPFIRVRGRSFMALVLAPEPPVDEWLEALDAQIERSPSFFDGRPVRARSRRAAERAARCRRPAATRCRRAASASSAPKARIRPGRAWSPGRRCTPNGTRPARPIDVPDDPPPAPIAAPAAARTAPSLLIDQPVRSGQSIVFEKGDVTIVGSVASGAEVIAGGSIHVYGALRGRAIAGLTGNHARAHLLPQARSRTAGDRRRSTSTADDMDAGTARPRRAGWLDGEAMTIGSAGLKQRKR